MRSAERSGIREWSGLGIVLLFVALALARSVSAQKPSREQELAHLRAEISRLSGQLEQVKRTRTGLQGEVAAADLELRLQGAQLAEAVAARDLAARRVAEGERQVGRLEASLDGARRDLRQRLAGLYRLGRQGHLRLFLSLKPDERFLPSVRLMRFLARRDRMAVDRFQQAGRELAAERERLVAKREETERWIDQEEERRRRLLSLRERKAVLLARVEKEQQTLSARSRELEAKERRLSSFLDLLYGRATATLAGTPMQEFRGVLDWPAEGRVAEKFGFRLDPRYKTRIPQNGIDLTTSPGDEVKVVFPGKVVFAAPFQGYGPTVIVQHPGRCFSLYAGLAGLRVGPEGMVSLGDAVGLASDKLYFEIRVENRPEDPLTWLR